ncbi:MAG TPA: SDR family NAD(P)-dependent oxidoreductase [Solirubrobacteraceae bacterium]|jgi:NAD(P)-dependent dehydrogenase (short-subunit alcohol dehydrogenase family)|nr:SDR family NAD(P)-dependent oxidoreductase [Solirubrobacteraceae bacterium]
MTSSDPDADRAVVLTGASGGIGVALTGYLLERGVDRLALVYRSHSDELFSLVREKGLDPEKHCFQADLANEDDVRRLAEAVGSTFGPVWGLINLAGASSNGVTWKLALDEFHRIIDSNLTTTFLTCREFIPAMRQAKGGRIINVSSVVAFSGVAGAAHYGAAKAGIVGLTKSMARELAKSEITANVLALGYFDYGMLYTVPDDLREGIRQQVPAARFGAANEIGGAIQHLLSDDSAYTTGQTVHINGGIYS